MNFQHVVSGSSVFLAYRVSSLRREVEWVPANSPGSHDAFALLEVVRHVGGVALVAGVDVL